MARPPRLGPYAPLSAGYWNDDALLAAGPEAETLFTRSLSFSSSQAADGYITERQVLVIGLGLPRLKGRIDALVREGLWLEAGGGYQVRQWLKWNRSADEIGVTRKKDRDRKATGIRAESGTDSVQVPDGTEPESDGSGTDSLECSDWSSKSEQGTLHDTSLHTMPTPTEPVGQPTVNQRAQALAKVYTDLVPLSRFPAIQDICKRAIGTNLYADDEIAGALKRLATEGRPITVDVLRVELEGLPTNHSRSAPTDLTGALRRAQAAEARA